MSVTKQQVAALYAAVFNRAPDQAGLEFWTTEAESFASMAEGFVGHPVFEKTYGELSNEDFVKAIYENVLQGAGDDAGVQFWVDALNAGQSRADFLASFLDAALNYDGDDADALTRKAALDNQVEAALYYTETMGEKSNLDPETDVASLDVENDAAYQAGQAAIADVTADPATVVASKAATDKAAAGEEEGEVYTLAEALAKIAAGEELPEGYSLSETTLVLEAGTIAAIAAEISAANEVIAGAANADELELEAEYAIEDSADNIIAAAEEENPLVADISLITLTDETITAAQRDALIELGFDAATLPGLDETSSLTEALATLADAQDAKAEFLKEAPALDTDLDGELNVEEGKATDTDIGNYYTKTTAELAKPVNTGLTDFANKPASLQDAAVAAQLEVLQGKATEAKDAAAPGMTGLLATVDSRVDTVVTNNNAIVKTTATMQGKGAELAVRDDTIKFNAAVVSGTVTAGDEGDALIATTDNLVIAKVNANGDLVLEKAPKVDDFINGVDGDKYTATQVAAFKKAQTDSADFIAAYNANNTAILALETAKTALENAVYAVVVAENKAYEIVDDTSKKALIDLSADINGITEIEEATFVSGKINLDATDVKVYKTKADKTAETETTIADKAAPKAEALIAANENLAAFEKLVAQFEEARELKTEMDSLNEAVVDAKAAIENSPDDEDAPGLGIKLLDDTTFTAGNDVYLFNEENGNVSLTDFGKAGQDSIFFNDTFTLVALGDDKITDKVGDQNVLEIFWVQNGTNVDLYVEAETFAGNGSTEADLTKVTLVGVNGSEIQDNLDNGLLTLGDFVA